MAEREPSSARKRSWSRMILALVSLYLLLVLAACANQRRFIYFPTRIAETAARELAAREGLQAWTNASGEIIGWRMRPMTAVRGSVLVFHGNAGSALHRSYIAAPLSAAGGDVFVVEYPGYGARAGKPSMDSILAAAMDALTATPTNLPLYIVAESLGTGPAAYLASKEPGRIDGLLFFAPYDDLAAVGQAHMRFLPVKLVMRDRFRPAEWLKQYRGSLKVVLADTDTVIPTRFGQRLYDAYHGPKLAEVIRGAGHNDIAAQSPEWWRDVFSFWETNRVSTR